MVQPPRVRFSISTVWCSPPRLLSVKVWVLTLYQRLVFSAYFYYVNCGAQARQEGGARGGTQDLHPPVRRQRCEI